MLGIVSSEPVPMPVSTVLALVAMLATVEVDAAVATDAEDAMDDTEAVDASDEDESDFFNFFLDPVTSLASMSKSFSSVTGFFNMTDLWRMSGWFQI